MTEHPDVSLQERDAPLGQCFGCGPANPDGLHIRSFPSPDEEWMQGYPQEMQDFAESVVEDRPPRSDAQLGRDVLVVIYAAYVAAAEGRRVDLSRYFPRAEDRPVV